MNPKQVLRRVAQNSRGMTLIELMVVIAILGMMATLITVYFVKEQDRAKVDSTKIQMHNIEQALDAYKIRFGEYPGTEQGLQELVTKEIMKELPKDMWGEPIVYTRNSTRSYTLKSFGADKQAGGEGVDADITREQ
jgi:general secretion pathway protein G